MERSHSSVSLWPEEAERRKLEVKRSRLAEGERGEEGRRKGARWCDRGKRGRREMSLSGRRRDEDEDGGEVGSVEAVERSGKVLGEGEEGT